MASKNAIAVKNAAIKNLMAGLEFPPALKRGQPTREALEPWISLTEELMGRGVRTPSELVKVTGVTYVTATNWIKKIKLKWMKGLTNDKINWRRENLYSEADAIAKAAWLDTMGEDVTPSQKAGLYKIVLLANQRKASLTGLDSVEVRIRKEVHNHTIVDIVSRVETEHGLAKGALGAIGRQAAKALSGETLELPALSQGTEKHLKAITDLTIDEDEDLTDLITIDADVGLDEDLTIDADEDEDLTIDKDEDLTIDKDEDLTIDEGEDGDLITIDLEAEKDIDIGAGEAEDILVEGVASDLLVDFDSENKDPQSENGDNQSENGDNQSENGDPLSEKFYKNSEDDYLSA